MHVIEFPGLWGLRFSVNPVAFNMFGMPIYWYGIIIASSILIAILLAMKDSKKFGIDSDSIIDLVLFAVPVAIVTSRLYYVIFTWDEFKDNLWDIFNIRQGGLAIYGAIIGAVIVAYFFAKKRNIGVYKLFDFASPYLPLAQAIGRWGNFINQEAFGTNTSLPWGMTGDLIERELKRLQSSGISVDPSQPVHPTFLYESLWNLGVFFILLWRRKHNKCEGEVFFLYMILYGIGRFWIEGLRLDSLMLGNLRVSQVLAAVFAIVFAVILLVRRKKTEEEKIREMGIGGSKYGELLKEIRQGELQEELNEAGVGEKEVNEEIELNGESKEKEESEANEESETRNENVIIEESGQTGEHEEKGQKEISGESGEDGGKNGEAKGDEIREAEK